MALPRRALEDLRRRSEEPRVRIVATSSTPETPRPRIFLRNASHESFGSVSTTSTPRTRAALDVGRVEPDVGHRRAVERLSAQLLDVGFRARGDGAHLVLGEPRYAHLLGHPLHLSGASACAVHLGHGGHEGSIDALVALDHDVR